MDQATTAAVAAAKAARPPADFVEGMPSWLRYVVDQDGSLQTWVASVMFWILVALAMWWLFRMERTSTSFKLYQFVADKQGKADKYALGYLVGLAVGSWGVWYLVSHDKMTEWYWNGYLWAFVVGAAAVGITRAIKAPEGPGAETRHFESHETLLRGGERHGDLVPEIQPAPSPDVVARSDTVTDTTTSSTKES